MTDSLRDVIAEVPRCCHIDRWIGADGRERRRRCPESPVEIIEGWGLCALHLPPGPKVA